jgi:regulator of sigma E protease
LPRKQLYFLLFYNISLFSKYKAAVRVACMKDTLPTGLAPDFLAQAATFMQALPGGGFIFTTLAFIIVLGVLIFVHELGHYAAARSVGVQVKAFSIGFGKVLTSWTDKHGTAWQIALVPLGGFVNLLGMDDGVKLTKSQQKMAYPCKPIWARAWIIFAGPLANMLLGFVLLVVVMLSGEHLLKAQVGEVMADMPAYGLLQNNDEITAMNGEDITDWDSMQKIIHARAGQPTQLVVNRAGGQVIITLTPKLTTFTDLLGDEHKVGRLGIAPSYQRFVVQHPPHLAVLKAAEKTWKLTSLTVVSLYKLLIGAIAPDNLTGPLGIADMAGQTAAAGVFALLMFMVIISINLGIVNLLPLPVLDGGHLCFLAYEAVRGKAPSARVIEYSSRVGLVLIVALAVFATFNDVKRLHVFGSKPATPVSTPVVP